MKELFCGDRLRSVGYCRLFLVRIRTFGVTRPVKICSGQKNQSVPKLSHDVMIVRGTFTFPENATKCIFMRVVENLKKCLCV